ncbi:MAG TPA: hypothetical protein VFP55_08305 [Solirubrobacteraceae bacterium]|nr:hypothetical protein [Solirubrobacteraceae bacterium]
MPAAGFPFPFAALDAAVLLLDAAVLLLAAALVVAEVARLVAELARLAALELPERDLLVPFFEVPLLELAPDPPVPFLDVEREVEPPVRFACVRPRLLPRRD